MTPAVDELCLLSIEDAAKLIVSKQLSPVELTDALLARIEALNPKLNAYMTVTAESARAEAKAAEAEIAAGKHRGALHGIPIAHKDLFDTKGVRTTAGMKIFADRVPDADAAVVERLREAGAISLGKLGMHEAAYGTTSDNVHFGAIKNPWDTERVPGGSSGGSGAAVAAGMTFAATGSDTGGSIRMPAAACGCVGLMPTYGRVSLRGAVPLSWTLDHAGPLTRTVRDAAIVLQSVAGHDPEDAGSVDVPVPDYLDAIDRGAKGLRVGLVTHPYFWATCEPEIARLVRQAAADLASAGADVREVDYPPIAAYQGAFAPIMFADAAAFHAPWYPSRRDDYSAQVAYLLDLGIKTGAPQLADALHVMREARAGGADGLLDGVDVLAVATMPCQAPTIAESRASDPGARMASSTSTFDLTGQPAIAVPCGLTDGGMPASISFIARGWDEATMLRAARAYEQVRGPFPAPAV
jgi:aspartyl-tRNA(Asn)/glutamyl-tRNA(Gln) amidotransferase subunit A